MSQQRIKVRRSKRRSRGTKYWVAVGTLAAYTAVGGSTRRAMAQEARPATAQTSSGAAMDAGILRFDIVPGALGDVLASYTTRTGITVVLPREDVRSVWSRGITGLYSPEKALEKLLAGTGLGYQFTEPTKVFLHIIGPTTAVEVTAVAPLATLTKYSENILETPQTISVVSNEILEQQATTTLRDALRNVAGISIAAGEGGAQGDNLTIRGFSARNDIFLDGMRDFGSYYRDPFAFEQIQVLEGPSSVTFGRGSTGGVVNQVGKSPRLDHSLSGTLNFGTDQTRRATVDWDHAVPLLGKGAAFRLNLMGHDAQVAERDVAHTRRAGVAPSLALGLGSPTTFTVGYLGEWADDTPDYGIPWYFNEPAPVTRQNYYGFEHGNFLKTHVNMVTTDFEHQFSGSVRLKNQTRYAHYLRDARITEARLFSDPSDPVTPETPLDEIDVTRNQIAARSIESFLQNQTDVVFHAHTFGLRHDLVAGVEASRETSDPTRYNWAGVPMTSLLAPDTSQVFEGIQSLRTIGDATSVSVGAYVLDTVRLGQHWDLVGGVRVDRFQTDFTQTDFTKDPPATQPFDKLDVMTSWRGAVVYKPNNSGSVYFSAGNSFNPSAESLSLSVANTANDLKPEENRTYEVGTKWNVFSARHSIRAAIFQTEKLNAREPSVDDPTVNVPTGKQRVRGFELQGSTRLTDRWLFQAGYAFLDSKVAESLAFPAAVGAQLANVPKNSFNFWTTYDFPWKLLIGGGGQFIDSRTASSTVPLDPVTHLVKEAPSYVVFNAMASYPVSEHVELQANIYNLANKYYYDQLHPGHIVPGPGRSLLGGITFHF